MHALSATELLNVWERGLDQPPVRRALLLLAAAHPESTAEALANLSIGRRDELLLELRETLFGPEFTGLADCPACNEKMELNFSAPDLRSQNQGESPGELVLSAGGPDVRFRLPTSADLLATVNREQLLGRCVLNGGKKIPAPLAEAIAEKMAAADPLADVQLALACASCGHQWPATFDLTAFFWREIGAAAQSLLREVHALAAAYGWTEPEILALSPARRKNYLGLVNA